jgi:hypothetical protein
LSNFDSLLDAVERTGEVPSSCPADEAALLEIARQLVAHRRPPPAHLADWGGPALSTGQSAAVDAGLPIGRTLPRPAPRLWRAVVAAALVGALYVGAAKWNAARHPTPDEHEVPIHWEQSDPDIEAPPALRAQRDIGRLVLVDELPGQVGGARHTDNAAAGPLVVWEGAVFHGAGRRLVGLSANDSPSRSNYWYRKSAAFSADVVDIAVGADLVLVAAGELGILERPDAGAQAGEGNGSGENLRTVSTVLEGSAVRAIALDGNIAYALHAASDGAAITMVDLADAAARVAGTLALEVDGRDLAVSGDRLLVVGGASGILGFDLRRELTGQEPVGLSIPGGVEQLETDGQIAYVGGPAGVAIVDLSSHREFAIVGKVALTFDSSDGLDVPMARLMDLAYDAGSLFVLGETGGALAKQILWTVDVSKPEAPHVRTANMVEAAAIAAHDGRLYRASRHGSVHVARVEPDTRRPPSLPLPLGAQVAGGLRSMVIVGGTAFVLDRTTLQPVSLFDRALGFSFDDFADHPVAPPALRSDWPDHELRDSLAIGGRESLAVGADSSHVVILWAGRQWPAEQSSVTVGAGAVSGTTGLTVVPRKHEYNDDDLDERGMIAALGEVILGVSPLALGRPQPPVVQGGRAYVAAADSIVVVKLDGFFSPRRMAEVRPFEGRSQPEAPEGSPAEAFSAIAGVAVTAMAAGAKELYVASSAGGLVVLDTRQASALPVLASFGPAEVGVGVVHALALGGTTLYAAGDDGVAVFDVTDAVAPELRGRADFDGIKLSPGATVAASGEYGYVADVGLILVVDGANPERTLVHRDADRLPDPRAIGYWYGHVYIVDAHMGMLAFDHVARPYWAATRVPIVWPDDDPESGVSFNFSFEPKFVWLDGSPEALAGGRYLMTEPMDLRPVRGEIVAQLRLLTPPGTEVYGASDGVRFEAEVFPADSEAPQDDGTSNGH